MTMAKGPLPLTRYRIRAPSGVVACASSTSRAHMSSARVGHGAGGGRGTRNGFWRGGGRGTLVLGREEQVPDHGSVRIHEAAREAFLTKPRDIRLLHAPAQVERQVVPLEPRDEFGIRAELRPETPEVHDAGG